VSPKKKKLYKVSNASNICDNCHSSCLLGKCTVGNDPNKCTICSSSTKFL